MYYFLSAELHCEVKGNLVKDVLNIIFNNHDCYLLIFSKSKEDSRQ